MSETEPESVTTRIVVPENTSPLKPTKGPVLNLITCYPFYYVGHAPKRFIVEAELAGALEASVRSPSWGQAGR